MRMLTQTQKCKTIFINAELHHVDTYKYCKICSVTSVDERVRVSNKVGTEVEYSYINIVRIRIVRTENWTKRLEY